MNALVDSMAYWLADFYLAGTVLLAAALGAMAACRQPAKRLAVAKAAIVAVALLAALCALPGWSIFSLGGVGAKETLSAVSPQSVTAIAEMPRFPETERVIQAMPALPQTEASNDANWEMPWLSVIVGSYVVGSAAIVIWLVAGAIAAVRLVRGAEDFPDRLRESLRETAGLGQLLVSAEIDVPVALGVIRPRVLLPREWINVRSSAELATVLAHEAAHLRNGDLRWLAASRLLLIALWAQPLYWWLRRQMRLDQETLADAAAAEVAGRQAYAEQLLAWAREVVARPRPVFPASVGLWEGASQLRRRVAVLVDEQFMVLRRCSRFWMCSVLTVAVSIAALLSILTVAPIAEVAVAAPEESDAPSESETQHSVVGGATVTVLRAGDPAIPWDYEPNAVRLEIEDAEGRPMPGLEATLYRVVQATGVREEAGQVKSDEHGVIEFRDVVVADIAADFQQKRQQGQFAGSLRDMFYLVLKQPTFGTVILPASDYAIASRGLKRRVRMRPAAELSGRVTDKDGKPVEGALVTAGALSGYFSLEGANAVKTDSEGRYRFTDLVAFDRAAGKSRIEEQMKWATAANPPPDKLYAAVYDPAEATNNRLVVTHPDFAVTSVEGGNVPGETIVVIAPAAVIEGRVVEYGTDKPAVGVRVQASGRIAADESGDLYQQVGSATPLFDMEMHTASTRTDAEGKYRLANLPAGTYEDWAQHPSNDWREIDWVSTNARNLTPEPGQNALQAPDLMIGPGGTIRGRLVDVETGQRVVVDDKNARVRAMFHFLDGVDQQQGRMQEVPVADDGSFTLRAFPTRARVFVDVGKGLQLTGTAKSEYRSPDDFYRTGQVFDLAHGEVADAEFPVMPAMRLDEVRNSIRAGFEVLPTKYKDKAIRLFTAALAISPDESSALGGRAEAYERSGNFAGAIGDFERLVELEPENFVWRNNLAHLLATSPVEADRDGPRAMELAKRALEQTRNTGLQRAMMAQLLDTLAAAQAEAGDFEAAVKTQREAMEKAPEGMRTEMRQRLEAYEGGKAWRREVNSSTTK